MQKVLAQDIQLRMNYVRKPDGEKRGYGKSRAGVGTKIIFPSAPSSTPPLSEDRPAFERHVKRLTLECKKRHNCDQEVISIYVLSRLYPFI